MMTVSDGDEIILARLTIMDSFEFSESLNPLDCVLISAVHQIKGLLYQMTYGRNWFFCFFVM